MHKQTHPDFEAKQEPCIQIGHPMIEKDAMTVPLNTLIRFFTSDGHCCMEVQAVKEEGKPLRLEVSGVNPTIQDGVLFDSKLAINPRFANNIHITTEAYD